MSSQFPLCVIFTSRFSVLTKSNELSARPPSAGAAGCRTNIFLDINEPYTRRLIQAAFASAQKQCQFTITLGPGVGMSEVVMPLHCDFQWAEYERIDWDAVLARQHGASSYFIRKGLSRKAQLAHYTHRHVCKYPESILKKCMPQTVILDTWAVWEEKIEGGGSAAGGLADIVVSQSHSNGINRKERMEKCLLEARKAMESAEQQYIDSAESTPSATTAPVWILKGSTVNKGVGIYIIHLYEQLVDICLSESDIREWVLQQYISRPLLLRQRKFHIRAYVLAVGDLDVYFCNDCLALCSGSRYRAADTSNLLAHITNTAFQDQDPSFREDKCVLLWNGDRVRQLLVKNGSCSSPEHAQARVEQVITDMKDITTELFRAYSSEFGVFSPLEDCFEHFGFDFLVDEHWQVYLLEVNPGPDFKQTGSQLQIVIETLMRSTIDIAMRDFNGAQVGNLSLVYTKKRNSTTNSTK